MFVVISRKLHIAWNHLTGLMDITIQCSGQLLKHCYDLVIGSQAVQWTFYHNTLGHSKKYQRIKYTLIRLKGWLVEMV